MLIACGGGGSGEAESGFTSDGGEVTGAESTAGDSSDDGADTGDDAAPIQCDAEVIAANEADPIPGCDGALVGAPPDPQEVGEIFGVPGPVTTTDPTIVGAWTPVIESDNHLAIHSIHRPTGKFLQFGGHDNDDEGCDEQADCDKIVWYPPAPCSPFVVGHANCDVLFDALPGTPEVEQHFEVPQPTELFCSAHVNLPPTNGAEVVEPLVLTVGGHLAGNNGIQAALTFAEAIPDGMVPQAGDWTWSELDDVNLRRWYPTGTTLSDGRSSVFGGLMSNELMCEPGNGFGVACVCDPNVVCEDGVDPCAYNGLYDAELCNPQCTVNGVASCSLVTGYNADVEVLDRDAQGELFWDRYENALAGEALLYPFIFVLPDLPHFETRGWNLGGKLIKIGHETAALNDLGAWIYDDTGAAPTVTSIGGESCTPGSSAVMVRPGKLMKFGGGSEPSRMTEVLDLSDPDDPDPQWRRVGPTSVARRYSTALLLPDGTALATGGTMAGNQGDVNFGDDDPGGEPGEDERHRTVFTTELFDPDSDNESWCRLADVPAPVESSPPLPPLRGYHSQSFLLPDGRIYLGASGRTGGGAVDHYDYQLFSPPYLFKGERPQVSFGTTVLPTVTTGTTLELERTGTVPVSRVTLVKLSSSTHNWDMEQRFVELTDVAVAVDGVSAEMPPSTCYATPGPYMVFAISDEGVPSIGQYLYVDGTCAAASETSEPPVAAFLPMAVNVAGTNGLGASCSSTATVLELQDFGRSVDELCQALGGCPASGTVSLVARLVASDTQAVPAGGVTLDTGVVTFTGGSGSITEALRLDVKSGAWTSAVDLGSGNHVIDLCATIAGITACMPQPLAIGGLAGTQSNAYGYRLGAIESRFEPIAGLPFTRRLMLADNGTATVAFPGGFRFPYFGTNYTTMYVGANGGIRFTSAEVVNKFETTLLRV